MERLAQICDGFDPLRVLVVGDVMLDEYLFGDVERVSPEAPVPVVRVEHESFALGGAGNVARNLLALGGQCRLCGVVGDDAAGRELQKRAAELGLDPSGLVSDAGRPTSRKTRVLARGQQMLRVDRESEISIGRAICERLRTNVANRLEGVTGVIVADYGKGTLPRRLVRSLMACFAEAELPVAVDPKHELAAFRGASLLKPNREEAERLSGLRLRGPADHERVLSKLQRRLGGAEIALTLGAEGTAIRSHDGRTRVVPTVQREVFDVQGAGDTSISALWLARLAGATLEESARIANAAAGVVVGKTGTATASRDEVRERLLAGAADAKGIG